MIEGHRWTSMPWSMNPRDFVTMTGSAALSFERTGASRPGLGLHRPDWPGSTQADETSRSAFPGRAAAVSRASGLNDCGTATNLETTGFRTTYDIDATDLNSGLFPPTASK